VKAATERFTSAELETLGENVFAKTINCVNFLPGSLQFEQLELVCFKCRSLCSGFDQNNSVGSFYYLEFPYSQELFMEQLMKAILFILDDKDSKVESNRFVSIYVFVEKGRNCTS